jgi:ABC-type oligopeptide transport system ATPase subunit
MITLFALVLSLLLGPAAEAKPGQTYVRTLYGHSPTRLSLPLENRKPQQRERFVDEVLEKIKNGYVGNHEEIDTLFRSVSPWLTNWEYATRTPTVVGVWGLTGSGKTSVVRQIFNLVELDTRLVYIDLKQAVSSTERSDQAIQQLINMFSPHMTQEREKWSWEPRKMVVVLDEFQVAQTRKPDGSRNSNPFVEFLMQCLGNQGEVSVENSTYRSLLHAIVHDKEILEALEAGQDPYISDLPNSRSKSTPQKKAFVRKRLMANQEALSHNHPNVLLDLSQALFVTLGNFPPGVLGGGTVNPEHLNAESLNRTTKSMTRTDLTEILKKLFQPEDLGRLGPDQIIFHSILEKDYFGLLDSTLAQISARAQTLGLAIDVDPKLKKFMVEKVMMPVLGPRVFLEVIYKTFDTPLLKVRRFVAEHYKGRKVPRPSQLWVSMSPDGTTIEWVLKDGSAPSKFEQASLWGDLSAGAWRAVKNDSKDSPNPFAEAQTRARERELIVAAVHEAAHTTVMAETQRIVPEVVQTDSQSKNSGGFTRFVSEVDLRATFRSDAIAMIAIALAGTAGEEIVFGEASLGGCDDFKRANEIAARLFGMGALHTGGQRSMANEVALRQFGPAHLGFDNYREGVDAVLREGLALAKKILRNENVFFLEVAQKLSEQPSLRAEELLDLVRAHWRAPKGRDEILAFRGSESSCAGQLQRHLKNARKKRT